MGRRKERRLAALSAAGRRVKLDLFAEPSGVLGDSSAQDEVGGRDDIDTKNQAGLPNSPSSSGKQADDPLLLLGQYSDDELELDDGSGGKQNKIEDSCIVPDDDQEKSTAGTGSEDYGIKEGDGPAADKLGQLAVENVPALMDSLEKLEDNGNAGVYAISTDVQHANGLTEQVTAASSSNTQVVGDVTSGWKIVLHEESNQYYYWNIVTGETSWEVPKDFSQATELNSNTVEGKEKDVLEAVSQNSNTTERNIHVPISEKLNEGYGGDALDDKKWDHGGDGLDDPGTLGETNALPRQSDDIHLSNDNATNINLLKSGDKGCYDTGTDFSSLLMKQCENLLQQLNTVKGSKDYFQGRCHIPKYILEVEMRLADIKSLACHGSSLLPFWEHSERRLKELGTEINNELQELNSELVNEIDTTSILPKSIYGDIKASSSENKTVDAASANFGASESTGTREFGKSNPQVDNVGASVAENFPSDKNPIGNDGGGKVEVGVLVHQELTPKTVLHTGEEVDMDVDMEVEDADAPSNLIVPVPSEQLNLPTLTADMQFSVPLESCSIPPPPDEDWIPPPPPDNEPFPPPPPDEPSETSCPQPPDLLSIQSFPYAESYNMYPSSHLQYYAQGNTGIAVSDLYAQTDGCQPTILQPPLYFQPSDTYGSATLAVNPTEAVIYYGLQGGSDSVQNPVADPTGAMEVQAAAGSTNEIDVSAMNGKANKASLEPSTSKVTLASAIISVTKNVSDSSVPDATSSVTVSSAAPKAQSKVQRNKKRTVAAVSSLRSNKKVSSLVDKWKAAKEELQEEEKEPENALEILEKKRQREIEEWRAQQIATGEAKDNANFQPLGGDWRERVKRKRAQLAKDSVQTSSDGVSEVNVQPDLDELSRGLPHGWQAYWDDSSKQVYYGNTLTSETTWVRPTN